MIRRCRKLDEFERRELARKDITYRDNLRIFESLRKEAVALGAFDSKNTSENVMDELEVVLRIARAVNGLR